MKVVLTPMAIRKVRRSYLLHHLSLNNLEQYIEVSPEAHQGSRVHEKSSPQPRPKPRYLVHTLRTFSGNVTHVSRHIEPPL